MDFLKNDPVLKEKRRSLRRNQSDAERFLWSKVRNRQLFGLKFFRQYSLGPYIIDFYCPERKLAIELDGGQHNMPEGIKQDAERTKYLVRHGVRVVRFWNNDVLINNDGAIEHLISICDISADVS